MFNRYDYDHIIIGGGSAGLSLASAAARLGVKVCLIDKDMLGGDCLHYGCVPSKTLIHASKLNYYRTHGEVYGLSNERSPANWSGIVKRISAVQSQIQTHDHPQRFRDMGCEIIFGEARFLDSHTLNIRLSDTWRDYQPEHLKTQTEPQIQLRAKKFTIATGSSPKIPDIPGLKEAGFITNEHVFRIRQQPQEVAIIGGGVIAAELAQALHRLGSKVTVLEHHPEFLGRLDTDVRTLLHDQYKQEGINIITSAQTQSVQSEEDTLKKKILFTINQQPQELVVDTILIASGRQANTDLGLETCGVHYNEHGIKVNKYLRTNRAHITAIGDVNGQSMFTHTANYEASIVLVNEIIGLPFFREKADYQKIGWTIFSDPEIAQIGHTEKSAQSANLKYEVVKYDLAKNDRAQIENATNGFVKVLLRKNLVIGVQIAAPRAGEMIREWQLIILHKIPFDKIARTTYIYPTYGEAHKWISSQHNAPKLFSPQVKSWLKIFKGYRGR